MSTTRCSLSPGLSHGQRAPGRRSRCSRSLPSTRHPRSRRTGGTRGPASRRRARRPERGATRIGKRAGSSALSRGGCRFGVAATRRNETPMRSGRRRRQWSLTQTASLVPGFPLTNPDHAWVSDLFTKRLSTARLGLYAEQPYRYMVRRERSEPEPPPAFDDRASVAWTSTRPGLAGYRLKRKAIRAYASQLPLLGLASEVPSEAGSDAPP